MIQNEAAYNEKIFTPDLDFSYKLHKTYHHDFPNFVTANQLFTKKKDADDKIVLTNKAKRSVKGTRMYMSSYEHQFFVNLMRNYVHLDFGNKKPCRDMVNIMANELKFFYEQIKDQCHRKLSLSRYYFGEKVGIRCLQNIKNLLAQASGQSSQMVS